MKLIHCADVHLDSAMTTHLNSRQAVQRRHELLITFIRMNEYAASHQVEMVLIAGDLFDTVFVTEHTRQQVFSTIEQNRKIQYVYIEGNHDEGTLVKEFANPPENFHYLMEGQSYQYKEVTVLAQERPQRVAFPQEGFHILMIHGEPDISSYGGRGIDYMALGHLHSYSVKPIDGRGIACYSGCLEGRGFDETGEKGFVLLDTEAGKMCPEPKLIPFATRKILACQVTVDGVTTTGELCGRIEEALRNSGASQEDLVKVALTGHLLPEVRIPRSYIEQMYGQQYFAFYLEEDNVKPYIDMKSYEGDISLKGAFIGKVAGSSYSEHRKQQIMELGITVLLGEEPV